VKAHRKALVESQPLKSSFSAIFAICHRFEGVIRIQSNNDSVSSLSNTVTATPDALNESGRLPRAHILNDQIDSAHIDAQFKRTRAYQTFQGPTLQNPSPQPSEMVLLRNRDELKLKIHVPNLESTCQNLRNSSSVSKKAALPCAG